METLFVTFMKLEEASPQFQALFQSTAAAYNIHQVIKEVN